MSSNHGRRYRVSKIEDGSQVTGSTDISETMTHTINIPTTNLRHSTMAHSQEVYLGDSNNDRQSETATETGNTCISETATSTVTIPTTNLGYKTTYKWKIVSASKYNSDRQPANIDVATKTGNNYICGTLTDSVEISTPSSRFLMTSARHKISQMIDTTIDSQKLHNWRVKRLYTVSGKKRPP